VVLVVHYSVKQNNVVLVILSRVFVTNNVGSGFDKRVYLPLIHTTSNTRNYGAIAISTLSSPLLHTHTRGFSVSASHLLATDLNTEISTSNHYEVLLLFCLQSLWNLRTKTSSGLIPPAYDWLLTRNLWLVIALNEFCHSYLYSRRTDMELQ
jgi:hypothetical protein